MKIEDIEKILDELNVEKSTEEFYLLLNKLDHNNLGRIPLFWLIIISFEKFVKALIPYSPEYSDLMR